MSSNIDIESSIETVITTPEVLGVKWDAEQITAVALNVTVMNPRHESARRE